jgi:hypothetical protein
MVTVKIVQWDVRPCIGVESTEVSGKILYQTYQGIFLFLVTLVPCSVLMLSKSFTYQLLYKRVA